MNVAAQFREQVNNLITETISEKNKETQGALAKLQERLIEEHNSFINGTE